MLRNLVIVAIITIFAASCLKQNDPSCPYSAINSTVPPEQLMALQTFIDTNNIVATPHPAGFYYSITTPGTSTETMGLCSEIVINYKAKLVNDSIFDQQMTTPVRFILGGLIEGFQVGLPLIKKGGDIKLYIPPKLGYGSTAVKRPSTTVGADSITVVPANSILVYEVKLVDYTQTY